MSEAVRFHLDEHIDPAIAVALRKSGIDVSTTEERDMRGQGDENHFELGRIEGRVIVTDDRDFLALARRSRNHAGVVFCSRKQNTIGDIVKFR